ncbi:uncharacterized protein Dwil_GK27446 [Drosophila willistoni]|uniref:Uncharacterized protein n=1 Tax=Drosophila willistoni TaxID=7260 RepID=A0A0Q9WR79_DROWI|nr:uncharacterized protein Dwil_GK27446 [Drosophila willistoni]
MNIVLFELIFISYFLYQLHVLSWQRSLLIFLQSYAERISLKGVPTSKRASKLVASFNLYNQIVQLHGKVSKVWLKSSAALYSYICAHRIEVPDIEDECDNGIGIGNGNENENGQNNLAVENWLAEGFRRNHPETMLFDISA